MDVTVGAINALTQTVRAAHDKAADQTEVFWPEIADEIESTKRSQVYVSDERTVKMREWDAGPRRATGGVTIAYEVTNKKFEASIAVMRDHVEDDDLNIYKRRFAEIGRAGKKWPDYLVRDAIQAGKTNLCSDGRYFFATNHYISPSKKSGNQSNLLTAKPLNKDNLEAAILAGRLFQDGTGERFGNFSGEVALIVDPTNEDVGLQLCNGELLVRSSAQSGTGSLFGAVQNNRKGKLRLLVIDDLANEPGVWYLADLKGDKPLLFQVRVRPDLVDRTDVRLDNVYRLDQFEYGSRARGAAGYQAWEKMIRVEPT